MRLITNVVGLMELIREIAPESKVRRFSSDTATVKIGEHTLAVQLAPTLMRLQKSWVQFEAGNMRGYRSRDGQFYFGPLAPAGGWVHQTWFSTVDELRQAIREAIESLSSGKATFFEGTGAK